MNLKRHFGDLLTTREAGTGPRNAATDSNQNGDLHPKIYFLTFKYANYLMALVSNFKFQNFKFSNFKKILKIKN